METSPTRHAPGGARFASSASTRAATSIILLNSNPVSAATTLLTISALLKSLRMLAVLRSAFSFFDGNALAFTFFVLLWSCIVLNR